MVEELIGRLKAAEERHDLGGGGRPPKIGGSNGGGVNGPIGNDQCKYCGKKGHWACECCKKKRDEAAHVAQAEEVEEPMLMLAAAEVNAASSFQPLPLASPSTSAKSTPIHLEENKLFVQLGAGVRGSPPDGSSTRAPLTT